MKPTKQESNLSPVEKSETPILPKPHFFFRQLVLLCSVNMSSFLALPLLHLSSSFGHFFLVVNYYFFFGREGGLSTIWSGWRHRRYGP